MTRADLSRASVFGREPPYRVPIVATNAEGDVYPSAPVAGSGRQVVLTLGDRRGLERRTVPWPRAVRPRRSGSPTIFDPSPPNRIPIAASSALFRLAESLAVAGDGASAQIRHTELTGAMGAIRAAERLCQLGIGVDGKFLSGAAEPVRQNIVSGEQAELASIDSRAPAGRCPRRPRPEPHPY